MFEFSVAFKYLIPRKKQLSVSLISLMSIGVISLVVWLVLVFLSVTEGIERNWLDKLTNLNAPLRITPTEAYYSSYYYQVDALSHQSQFRSKNIAQKANAALSDPFSPEEDGELPSYFPEPDRLNNGLLKDPVKTAYAALADLRKKRSDLIFQDYELSGGLMRLQMLRPKGQERNFSDSQSFLTQVSYIASFSDKSPYVYSLIAPPQPQDLNHLFYLATHSTENSRQDAPSLIANTTVEKALARIRLLLDHSQIKKVATTYKFWQIPYSLFSSNGSIKAEAHFQEGKISHLTLPTDPSQLKATSSRSKLGTFQIIDKTYSFKGSDGEIFNVSQEIPLIADGRIVFEAKILPQSIQNYKKLKDIHFLAKGKLQSYSLSGEINWDGIEIIDADFKTTYEGQNLPWITYSSSQAVLPINSEKESGILLARSFRDNGVMIGDRGYLSYTSATASSIQEQRLPIFIAGFYDPGVMSIGSKLILVPPSIAHTINSASSSFNLDSSQSSGILVWFKDLKEAETVKAELLAAFKSAGIDSYWKVATFHEYDFAKDLLEQFQSDKYLFTLIGIIILVVACCNIISLLVMLVNDKKKEIGILQAMGAPSRSIALIFGSCGAAMGILSSVIGTIAALLTLRHIDSLVNLLSMIQGHDAFNSAFYGSSLPNELSSNAVIFVLVITPLISLCAGLVPAIKACRLKPSEILRSE